MDIKPYRLIKIFVIRILLALIAAVLIYFTVDYMTIAGWNNSESRIVRVLDAGDETPVVVDGGNNQNAFQMMQRLLRIEILTGEQAGAKFNINAVRLKDSGVDVIKGRRYLLVEDVFNDGTVQYSIADAYRISLVAFITSLICFVLAALTGWRGVKAIIGLLISILVIVFLMIPMIVDGWQPIWPTLASTFIISCITVYFVVKRAQYRLPAFLGSFGGVLAGFLLGLLMVYLWQLTGLASDGAALLASTLPGIDMRGILLSAILIGAIGAVLDVGISVTASMAELVDYDPEIPLGRLFLAGINVGSEVLGSMINTLILAYIGSSLPMAVLISSAGVNYIGLMNDPYVAQELAQSLAGTVGLLLTIPVTALFFTLQEAWMRRNY
ncbi:MAG: YibE/F family protein [Synergistaceae bacterium]|nr:YibE/F family protein [Synergistaceae bacterium]